MLLELSLLALVVNILGVNVHNILVRRILAIRGHQITLQSAFVSRNLRFVPSLLRT